MRYWWVNQNQTYKSEINGGFLWSPKTRSDGARNPYYDTMREVAKGDIVFSFCDTKIKAIGIVEEGATSSPKPDFGKAGENWDQEGWLVKTAFKELSNPPRPKDFIHEIRPHLPTKYSPLLKNGNGLQSVYLAAVPQNLADALIRIIGSDFSRTIAEFDSELESTSAADDRAEEAIAGRTDIGTTKITQLVQARRGQGIFKTNVKLNEHACRITGISDIRHLKASHIKPWRLCNDEEKLNGCNGLLLAPHIDHLFDLGYISFADSGDLLISPRLDISILNRWGISVPTNVGPFNSLQMHFLAFHRSEIFKKT